MTEVSVHLPNQFTPGVADALRRLMARVPPGTVLELDFSAVRQFQDQALLQLARDVLAGTVHYALHGLTRHQMTLFGYLGALVLPGIGLDGG